MKSPVDVHALLAGPALAAEREFALACAARGGDRGARAELAEASLRLVALRLANLRVPARHADDAFQSGTLGLLAAIDHFDPDRGVRLATYAWPWITAGIRSGIPHEGGLGMAGAASMTLDRGTSDDVGLAVASLPAPLSDVVRLRFGLGEAAGGWRTRADVAARLGLTVAQVRWVEQQAFAKLRLCLARLGHRAPERATACTEGGTDPL